MPHVLSHIFHELLASYLIATSRYSETTEQMPQISAFYPVPYLHPFAEFKLHYFKLRNPTHSKLRELLSPLKAIKLRDFR